MKWFILNCILIYSLYVIVDLSKKQFYESFWIIVLVVLINLSGYFQGRSRRL